MVDANPTAFRYSVLSKGKEIAFVHGITSLCKMFGYGGKKGNKFSGIGPGKTVTFSFGRKKKTTKLISQRFTAKGVTVNFDITVKGVPKSEKIQKEWHDKTILPLKTAQGGKAWKRNPGTMGMSVILLDNKLLAVFGKKILIYPVVQERVFLPSVKGSTYPKNAQGEKMKTSFGTVLWRPYKESDGEERITKLGKKHFKGYNRWITKETCENTTFSVKGTSRRREPNVAELEAAHKRSKVRFANK